MKDTVGAENSAETRKTQILSMIPMRMMKKNRRKSEEILRRRSRSRMSTFLGKDVDFDKTSKILWILGLALRKWAIL